MVTRRQDAIAKQLSDPLVLIREVTAAVQNINYYMKWFDNIGQAIVAGSGRSVIILLKTFILWQTLAVATVIRRR